MTIHVGRIAVLGVLVLLFGCPEPKKEEEPRRDGSGLALTGNHGLAYIELDQSSVRL
ncbi:hypothetical protein [Archangium lansingense]|uniref:Lipoprotein n=1 Tax=Archangium lansingense TaxID=2995310 RepID=A0ABT4ADS7_9BACT|nr:hypothetical protein [Archangium lansinium]MCY1079816.1 hypothetical protein [Archangium lansinium]